MIVQDTMQYLSQLDPEVGASVQEEFARQQRNIELIASENIVSPAVMVAMGTCLTNKYAEGYPGHRYYGGCFAVDITEELARQRACQLFGCKYANVQPHSGANANLAAFFALAQPGDTILGMNLAHGGHLSHGSPVNISGKYFHIVPYGLGEDETIDYDALLETAKAASPRSSLPVPPPIPGSSTSLNSGRWPMPWARISWWTWPTSPVWWRLGFTPPPFPMRTW